jgi:hypothetical protein
MKPEEIQAINDALKTVRDDLARKAEAFDREIKATGTVGAEAKASSRRQPPTPTRA